MTQNPQIEANAKLSAYLMTIIFIVVALGLVALAMAVILTYNGGDLLVTGTLAIIGAIIIGLAVAVFYQNKRSMKNLKNENPKVMTFMECPKCKERTSREFQRGDYIRKEMGNCPKCADKQYITAIYREVLEKEKTYDV